MNKNRLCRFLVLIWLSISAAACGFWQANLPSSTSFSLAKHKGTWRSVGYGYLLAISEQGMALYDVSKQHCLPSTLSSQDLAKHMGVFKDIDDSTIWISSLEGASAIPFTKVEPASAALELKACSAENPNDPRLNFDYFAEVMAEHYAFFELHQQDWHKLVARARTQVTENTTPEQLFQILTGMLAGFNDAHLFLKGEVNGQPKTFKTGASRTLRPALDLAFKQQTKITEPRSFRRSWYGQYKNAIAQKLLNNEFENLDDLILWGQIGDLGYINILRMTGYSDSGSLQDEVAMVEKYLTHIVANLGETDAIIVDVTANGGGEDIVGLTVASFFSQEDKPAFSKVAKGAEYLPQAFVVKGRSKAYLNPVYLLTSDHTVSAAETFTLAMTSLPSVTHVGDRTRGALSDTLDKSLPNGWQLGLSNEVYLDNRGHSVEGIGIKPDREIAVFASGDIYQSHLNAVAELVQYIKTNSLAATH